MTTEPEVLYQVTDGVATLTLNRGGKLNALAPHNADGLATELQKAAADPAVRVVVLRGAGRAFSTGFDLASVDLQGEVHLGCEVLEKHFEPLMATLRAVPKPVVAAVHGPAAGVSVALALACDLTLAARSAYFLIPFINLALVPDGGLTWFLPRLLGAQRATALALLGGRLSAEEAAAQGLIWRTVDDAKLEDELSALLKQLVELPAGAAAKLKRAVQLAPVNSLEQQLEVERRMQEECGQSADFKEGVAAFLGKRKPVFRR
jgi:2-(1,2-epoxy-1,2-dihydrophenyl)acetyl-CoA isomerase